MNHSGIQKYLLRNINNEIAINTNRLKFVSNFDFHLEFGKLHVDHSEGEVTLVCGRPQVVSAEPGDHVGESARPFLRGKENKHGHGVSGVRKLQDLCGDLGEFICRRGKREGDETVTGDARFNVVFYIFTFFLIMYLLRLVYLFVRKLTVSERSGLMHHRDKVVVLRRSKERLWEGVGRLELVLPRALEVGGVHEHHDGVS